MASFAVVLALLCMVCAVSAQTTADKFDYGDAPASYATDWSSDGPRHIVHPGDCIIGSTVSKDSRAQINMFGDGDASDDGVRMKGPAVRGSPFRPEITTSGDREGYLFIWVDWDRDGSFSHPTEMVVNAWRVSNGAPFWPVVPKDASLGLTFMRVRVAPSAIPLTPTGTVDGGEVEDHPFYITDCEVSAEPLPLNDKCTCTLSDYDIRVGEGSKVYMYKDIDARWTVNSDAIGYVDGDLELILYAENGDPIKTVRQDISVRDGRISWAPHKMLPGAYQFAIRHKESGCFLGEGAVPTTLRIPSKL